MGTPDEGAQIAVGLALLPEGAVAPNGRMIRGQGNREKTTGDDMVSPHAICGRLSITGIF